jgi:hypothetical protein
MAGQRTPKQDSHGRSTYGRIPGGELPDVGEHVGAVVNRGDGGPACRIARAGGLFRSEEADRARAVLLSLDGWTSERIAAAFCVQATACGIGAGFSVEREWRGCAPARRLVPSRRVTRDDRATT